MPAILLHGAHHMLGLAGGLGFFAASLFPAERLLRAVEAGERTGGRPSTAS